MTTQAPVDIAPADTLFEDLDLYPRASVDGIHVQALADAIRSGATLPPVIACRATRRLVDGFHRRRAHLRVNGAYASIDVEWRDYATEADLYADAVALNAAHGRRLTGYDYRRIAIRGHALGLDAERVAALLHVTPDRLARGHLTAEYVRGNGDTEVIPLKRTLAHLANTRITDAHVRANAAAGGFAQAYYIKQVATLIETGALNATDTKLMEELMHLGALIHAVAS